MQSINWDSNLFHLKCIPSQLPSKLLSWMIFFQKTENFKACWKKEWNASHDKTSFILAPIRIIFGLYRWAEWINKIIFIWSNWSIGFIHKKITSYRSTTMTTAVAESTNRHNIKMFTNILRRMISQLLRKKSYLRIMSIGNETWM